VFLFALVPKGGSQMQGSELRRVLSIPISCPHCKRDSQHVVGFFINKRLTGCPFCIKPIDLTRESWRTFLDRFDVALKELQPFYATLD
jgi:hypothetical protein